MPKNFTRNKSHGMMWYLALAVLLVVVVVGTLTAMFTFMPAMMSGTTPTVSDLQWWKVPGAVAPNTAEQVALSGQYTASAQVAMTVGKLWGGGAWSTTGNVAIYDPNDLTNAIETLNLDANSAATTVNKFTTGDVYYLKIYNDAGSEKMWQQWTVPGKSGLTDATIYAPVKMFTTWTPSLKLVDGNGATYANSGTWNITTGSTPGYAVGQMTVDVRNTVVNTGFVESNDPIYNVAYKANLLIAVTGTSFDVIAITGGYDYAISKSTAAYYVVELPADQLVKLQQGNDITGGAVAIPFTVDMTGATSATITLSIYEYSSASYFSAHNANFGTTAYKITAADAAITVTA